MSIRPIPEARRGARGFTLLECEVALIVLTLLVIGLSRLIAQHNQILADVESWTADDPTYYIARADNDLARVAGMPAELVPDPPLPPSPPPPVDAYVVTIESVETGLDPPAATLTLTATEP